LGPKKDNLLEGIYHKRDRVARTLDF